MESAENPVIKRNREDWRNARRAAEVANPAFIEQSGNAVEAEVRKETEDFGLDVKPGVIAEIVQRQLKRFERK